MEITLKHLLNELGQRTWPTTARASVVQERRAALDMASLPFEPESHSQTTQETSMSEAWQYQVRVTLAPRYAELARKDAGNAALDALNAVLARHRAELKCQFDAFADYVAQAEREGIAHYPLYEWTKQTIENPAKKARYLEVFTLYVNGDEVYDKALADALEADLNALADDAITSIRKFDTNPANNPQPPRRD
jgi:hypothetical protein